MANDRQIKFRGWNKESKEWQYTDENRPSVFWKDVEDEFIDPATVGEFIGRLDENKQAIYDGDVMEYYNYCGPKGKDNTARRLVKWNKFDLCWENCWQGKIIGNIYENKNLLDTKTEK